MKHIDTICKTNLERALTCAIKRGKITQESTEDVYSRAICEELKEANEAIKKGLIDNDTLAEDFLRTKNPVLGKAMCEYYATELADVCICYMTRYAHLKKKFLNSVHDIDASAKAAGVKNLALYIEAKLLYNEIR